MLSRSSRRQYSDLEVIGAFYMGEWGTIPKQTKTRWLREASEWRVEQWQAAREGRQPEAGTRIARALLSAERAKETLDRGVGNAEGMTGSTEVGTGPNAREVDAVRMQLSAALDVPDTLAVVLCALLRELMKRAPTLTNEQLLEALTMLLLRYEKIYLPTHPVVGDVGGGPDSILGLIFNRERAN